MFHKLSSNFLLTFVTIYARTYALLNVGKLPSHRCSITAFCAFSIKRERHRLQLFCIDICHFSWIRLYEPWPGMALHILGGRGGEAKDFSKICKDACTRPLHTSAIGSVLFAFRGVDVTITPR